jgi:hypothetical protein
MPAFGTIVLETNGLQYARLMASMTRRFGLARMSTKNRDETIEHVFQLRVEEHVARLSGRAAW